MVQITRTPAIARLQAQLGLPDLDGNITPFEPSIIMSVDVEKYGYASANRPVTEIGLAFINTSNIRRLPKSASNLEISKLVQCHHFRPKESGHLRNGNFGGVDFNKANDFDHGKSEWLWRSQIKQAVEKLVCVPDPNKPGAFLPVTIIKQGGNGDIKDIGEFAQPQFDLKILPSIEEELELQTVTAKALPGLYSVGLAKVLAHLGLSFPNKHNAGNDAMGQLVCALHMAIEEYRQRTPATNGRANDTPPADLLQALSTALKAKASRRLPITGTHDHCNRCGRDHAGNCNTRVGTCKRCLCYNRHITAKCFWGNDKIIEQQRQSNYARTKANNDKFSRPTAPYVPLEETTLSRRDHILEPETPRDELKRVREAEKREYDRQWTFLNSVTQVEDGRTGRSGDEGVASADPGSSSGQGFTSDEQGTSSATTPELANQGMKVLTEEPAGLSLEEGIQTASWAQIVSSSAPVADRGRGGEGRGMHGRGG